MPRAETARGILGGETRDIAILSRVGRPYVLLSWASHRMGRRFCPGAARRRQRWNRSSAKSGPGTFCLPWSQGLRRSARFVILAAARIGLLGLRNLCVSRLTHPRELLRVGQQLPVLIQSLDPARRRVGLTLRELLGTWQENAARFRAGQTVTGIACGKTDYGVFIALTPESVRAGRTGRYTGTRPAGMRVHQGHSPGDAQAEADRPAPAGHSASAAAALHEDGRTAGCVAVRKPGKREDRDGVLTLG